MSSSSGLLSPFIAAIQASLSVLLVISYGSISAHYSLLDSPTAKKISKICVKLFLPLLLLVQIGSQLHAGSAHRYLIILIWAIICHVISFGVGVAAHLGLGMQDWITAAIMFNNTTSYPLLLVQSLDQTGILGSLIIGDEGTKQGIERAKSYFLVFATVSSCLTFAVGPRLMDSEHAVERAGEDKSAVGESGEEDDNGADVEGGSSEQPADEESRLLLPSEDPNGVHTGRDRQVSVISITFFPSPPKYTPDTRRAFYIPRSRWRKLSPRIQWWLLFFYDFLNAPLLGAVLGAIIGFTKPLHRAFFADTYSGGVFTAWLTESFRNVGGLFVPLPLIVAGVSLYTSYQESKEESQESQSGDSNNESAHTRGSNANPSLAVSTTLFILLTRFVLWPILSISLIYALITSPKTKHLLSDDRMLWFAMMLMPTGPPAMKLITMVQVSDSGVEDERKVAKTLTVSYIVSPVLAVTVVGALRACQNAIGG